MGTDKRQRQKDGRAIRIAAAEAAQRKADQRALVLRAILVVVVVGVIVAGLFVLSNRDDDETASTTTVDPLTSTTLPVDTTPALPSAAGKPCVAQVTPPAEGEPTVDVRVGDAPTELVIEDLTVGTGEEITDPAETVKVNYVGVACSTGETFDSSFARGEPIEFPLDGVIPGWTQGLMGMKVGGTRLLGIPGDLAYGAAGSPPAIAPDEALWFVVQLEGIGASTPDTTAGAGTGTETTIAPDTSGTGSSTTATTSGSTTTAAP